MSFIGSLATDDPATICRAGSAYISADRSANGMFGLNCWDSVKEVLEVVNVAYERLPQPEKALFAPTLQELRSLALIERVLELH